MESGWPACASGGALVRFPADDAQGELYTTVMRGNVYEGLFTSREAIAAVQNEQPMPSGTMS